MKYKRKLYQKGGITKGKSGKIYQNYNPILRDKDGNEKFDSSKEGHALKKKYKTVEQWRKYGFRESLRKKYQQGGIYGDNTIAAAGQAGAGSTANIVFNESNPELQQNRMAFLNQKQQDAMSSSDAMARELQEQAQADAQEIAAFDTRESKLSTLGKGLKGTYDMLGKETKNQLSTALKETGKKVKGLFTKNQPVSPEFMKRLNLGTSSPGLGTGTGLGTGSLGTGTLGTGTLGGTNFGSSSLLSGTGTGTLGGSTLGTGTLGSGTLGSGSSFNLSGTGAGTFTTPYNTKLVGDLPGLSGTGSGTSTGIGSNLGSNLATKVGTGFADKGFMATTGVGTSGIGTGLSKFATSGAGIGTIASLAGTGVKMLSDDKDATTLNFGEGAGSTLAGIGTGIGAAAGVGAAMGTAVPLVGNIIGAGLGAAYGLGSALVNRNKAREAERKQRADRIAKVEEHNQKVQENVLSATAAARAGELQQKTYSGYDLGRNVVAQMGGMRLGVPRYGY